MKKLLSAILIILLSGCMSLPQSHNRIAISVADNPITSRGVSFNVPPHGKWEMVRIGSNLQMGMTTSQTHSHVVLLNYGEKKGMYRSSNEFLEGIKNTWEQNIKDARYDIDFSEAKLDSTFGDFCIRLHRRYRDKGAVNRGNEGFLILEEYGYVLIHPDYPSEIIVVNYSERFAAGEQTYMGIENRKAFFNSFRIIRKN